MSADLRFRERAVEEVRGAKLGHASRVKRMVKVVDRLAEQPGESLPAAMVTSAEIEGAYQLLNTPAVSAGAILDAHVQRTLDRCEERAFAVLIHDTTSFSFGGDSGRTGLGRLSNGGQGFFAHICLAATMERVPLGTVGWRTYSRTGPLKKQRNGRHGKRSDRESLRWGELAVEAGNLGKGRFGAVHVMDSEADDYDLFATLVGNGQRFVIRAGQNRRVTDEDSGRLFEVLEGARVKLRREVHLSERRDKATKSRSNRDQPRKARVAHLAISSRPVTLRRPTASSHDYPEEVTVNVVHVHETDTPAGCEPVEWILLTTERIATADDLAMVVDIYRCRWVIEEFFKALKTGCAYEKAQLESFDALLRYLAMLVPVAWQMLLLRSMRIDEPDAPASTLLTQNQLRVLRALSDRSLERSLSTAAALAAIAQLGGHIRANGPPGWIVLWRGMRHVLEGAVLLERLDRSGKRDQS